VHHVVLDRWSRGSSFLHSRDARVKLLVAFAYLVAVGTLPGVTSRAAACCAAFILAAIAAARLPFLGVALRAAVVLPFVLPFAAFSVVAGDPPRAVALATKSYLSAAAVVVLVGSTPLPALLRALESLGVPRFLTLVVQFLHRYLFVISEQVQHMRMAMLARGGGRRRRFSQASGAVATLFARSWARAEGIHGAMLARGFEGRMTLLAPARAGAADFLFLATGILAAVALRVWR
jgi:cobalt/nickel transport system permease protein